MRLPTSLISSPSFVIEDPNDLILALGGIEETDKAEILRLHSAGLPPVISVDALSVMLGYNPGFIYSMMLSPSAHYRFFTIPSGKRRRSIQAPKVALKGLQTWLAYHFQEAWKPAPNVYGFVRGKSHIDAAKQHVRAKWVCSVDIENFFPSVKSDRLRRAFQELGYTNADSQELLIRLCSLKGALVQGSPVSPVLSNIVLKRLDQSLTDYARSCGAIFTRYADDIVFSGKESTPDNIVDHLVGQVERDGWKIAHNKTRLDLYPGRLKVHGLLVHGSKIRLTKGYRNRIRAYNHLLTNGKVPENEFRRFKGHLEYAKQTEK